MQGEGKIVLASAMHLGRKENRGEVSRYRRRATLPGGGWVESEGHQREKVGDRLLPERASAGFPAVEGQPGLRLDLAVIDGLPQCVGLHIEAVEGGRDVRTTDMRAVQIETWVETFFALLSERITEESPGSISTVVDMSDDDLKKGERLVQQARASTRRKIDTAFLERVAEVYRRNVDDRPLEAIRQTFGVKHRTASDYAKRAEQAGLLPRTTPGKRRGK